jgi:hypothetical protein
MLEYLPSALNHDTIHWRGFNARLGNSVCNYHLMPDLQDRAEYSIEEEVTWII